MAAHQSGKIQEAKAKSSLSSLQNIGLNPEPGLEMGPEPEPRPRPGPGPEGSSSSSPASTVALRPVRVLGGLLSITADPGPDGTARSQLQDQNLGSTRSSAVGPSRAETRRSQQEEPEALLDLILESQVQRLEDQRASLSLLPHPGETSLCRACSPHQVLVPTLDFYYTLIQYQSHRIEDQRCPLPDLQEPPSLGSEGPEDFFSLVQRVQSRRMDEQRASMLWGAPEEDHN